MRINRKTPAEVSRNKPPPSMADPIKVTRGMLDDALRTLQFTNLTLGNDAHPAGLGAQRSSTATVPVLPSSVRSGNGFRS